MCFRSCKLFDDDAKELFLAGAEKEFGWRGKIDIFPEIVHASFIDFQAALLDQTLSFTFGRSKRKFDEQRGKLLCRAARDLFHRRLSRGFAVAEDPLEIVRSFFPCVAAMESGDDF